MAAKLDVIVGGGGAFTPSSNPEDQASHAAAPQHFNAVPEAKDLVIALAVILALFYVLHIVERVIRRELE